MVWVPLTPGKDKISGARFLHYIQSVIRTTHTRFCFGTLTTAGPLFVFCHRAILRSFGYYVLQETLPVKLLENGNEDLEVAVPGLMHWCHNMRSCQRRSGATPTGPLWREQRSPSSTGLKAVWP
jgi:hypothetical protein